MEGVLGRKRQAVIALSSAELVYLSAGNIADYLVIVVHILYPHRSSKNIVVKIFPSLALSHGLAITKPNLVITGIFGHGAVRLNNGYR